MSTEIVETQMFNASITVTELLIKTLENCAKDLASRCISEAANRHGFDASEEIRVLGLENLSLIRKKMVKKSVSKGDTKKEKKPQKEKKSVFPMPFISDNVDLTGCQGLAYNRGLFTQCQKKRMENGNFCKGCQSQSDKNTSGCPDCGTVEMRLACGLYEFKDSKGRNPVSYVKVLEKLKLSIEASLEEAGKLNIEIPNEHFVVVEKVKKTKGRPKKTGLIEADNVTDLFAKLSAEGNEEVIEEGEDKPVKGKKAKLTDEEKAAKKAALEAERAIKKAEREAKLAAEKAEKEAKRKAESEQRKAEREAKLAAEKAEREAKRAQEKAEREAKKAAEKAEKAEKAAEKSGKAATAKKSAYAWMGMPVAAPDLTAVAPVAAAVVADVAPVADAAPAKKVSVTRIQINGKAYLKSNTNILYDPSTKEEVGLWDPETKTIQELPEEEEEEEEEEYV
jgi:hypothetical protein